MTDWACETETAVDRYFAGDQRTMSRTIVIQYFRKHVLPSVVARYGHKDIPAKREAWNNFTDALCRDGVITSKQYEAWEGPY